MENGVVTASFCLTAYWALCHLVCTLTGRPIRRGEDQFISEWLRGELDDNKADLRHLHQIGAKLNTMLNTTGELHLARRYQNGGNPFILLNYDRYGRVGGLIGRRLRRLIDVIAAREGIPVLPVAFTPWNVAITAAGSSFSLVHRRGRECVFTRTKDRRTDYFLSGFDSNESPPLYFLTQLPGPAASIKEAREILKPSSVILAERDGRKVYRQGDMFAVPTELATDQLWDLGATVASPGCLYGTAHVGEDVASLPDGTQLARGWLTHHPPGRSPDHRPLKLAARKWHLIAKNTTPMRVREVKNERHSIA